ncbi:DMT family transporter [Streptomyces sp. NPDC006622]|uniref:DMT family transporter n=1 Tax=Streptomyces sp. NPDC006622 TaxID=3155459 RepID=UPI0033AB281B
MRRLDLLSAAAVTVTVAAFAVTAPLTAAATAPALFMAAGRNLLGFAALGPVVLWRRRAQTRRFLAPQNRHSLLYGLAAGTCLAVHFATFMPSTRLTSVAMATTLVSTQPVWQALIATAFGARLSRAVWAGMALAVCGAAVAAGRDWQGGSSALLGDLLALAGAMSLAGYTAFSERARLRISTSVHSAVCALVCSLQLTVLCLVTGTIAVHPDRVTLLALVGLLVFPQLLGLVSLNFALGRVPATTVSVALLLEAPAAALLAWLWLDQVPTGFAWAGLALIMVGVSVVVISDARNTKTSSGILDGGGPRTLITLPVITLDETAVDEMHALVWDAAHAGRHAEAARIARTLEASAVRAHGVGSPQATRWIEVQAVLARLEGAPHRACALWLTVVQHRLRTQSDDITELRACMDRAYHEWSRVEDPNALYDLAPSLLLLHARVPGHRPQMADAVRQRLRHRGIAMPTMPA